MGDPAKAPGAQGRRCSHCGQAMPPGAAFCRQCGQAAEPVAKSQPPGPPLPPLQADPDPDPGLPAGHRHRRAGLVVLGIAALLAAGLTAGIFIAKGGSDAATTTVVNLDRSTATDEGSAEAADAGAEAKLPAPVREGAVESIEGGRYVEAGSFRSVDGALVEQQRLGNRASASRSPAPTAPRSSTPAFRSCSRFRSARERTRKSRC